MITLVLRDLIVRVFCNVKINIHTLKVEKASEAISKVETST